MRMTWSELLFAHSPVDPNIVAPLLPRGLALDTRDGQAWIGIVPFLMSNVAPRFNFPRSNQGRCFLVRCTLEVVFSYAARLNWNTGHEQQTLRSPAASADGSLIQLLELQS